MSSCLCRRPRAGQHAPVSLLQQRGRDQLSAHALRAVRSPEADHGAASGRRQGRHRQPGPHGAGKSNTGRTGAVLTFHNNAETLTGPSHLLCLSGGSDLSSGGLVLPLHPAGTLWRDHSHLHRPGQYVYDDGLNWD